MTIRKSIHVKRTVDAAFRVFTEDIGKWWPLEEGYTFGGARADQIHLEARAGGRFYERFSDGEEFVVGSVTAFEPPSRVVLTWKAPSWNAPTEVEVRFTAEGGGTRVDLEHRGWERAGAAAEKAAPQYGGGWDLVLARYAAAA
jgi:uncharacterized protein YndB with AHSA1/START domain